MPDLLPGEQPHRARYTVIVQASDDVIPEPVRLRRFVKWLGRRCGLDVLHIAERAEAIELTPVDRLEDK